ncbi:MAG: hypothetical protein CMP23_07810 [Rickettsiales bacterium]|nr:hypothetical protein [Rickettsiales bacterium]
MHQNSTFLLFGGAGLVGMATCRLLARELQPKRVVVASLKLAESQAAVKELVAEHPEVEWVPEAGNLFVPTEFAHMSRGEILGSPDRREKLLDFTFGDFEAAYQCNHLAVIIRRHSPDAIVDCVNTATGISYQDIFDSTASLRYDLGRLTDGGDLGAVPDLPADLETGLLAQAMPQIIRHVRLLFRATTDANTSIYVKVGTTGTGGMGLNIPYTHSEDRPSRTLLAKNAVAFAHTGLLFLLARTPEAPAVKEIKPAAMIGYRAVQITEIPGHGGAAVPLYKPQEVAGASLSELVTKESEERYQATGENLEVAVVNTGENGLFAKGEFGAITALKQMEFVTPEEIADRIVMEISGGNTGNDVIAALDGAVMTSSYRAGQLRQVAMKDLHRLEASHGVPSIALGALGPPELSKLLFEAWMLKDAFGDSLLNSVHDADGQPIAAEHVATRLAEGLKGSAVACQAVSIGIPILLPDGDRFLRGPVIKVPEIKGKNKVARINSPADLDLWARRGWIDLRPANMRRWQERFTQMERAREELTRKGSAAVSRRTYLPVGFKIGDVVAWIFNNEMGGYRIK